MWGINSVVGQVGGEVEEEPSRASAVGPSHACRGQRRSRLPAASLENLFFSPFRLSGVSAPYVFLGAERLWERRRRSWASQSSTTGHRSIAKPHRVMGLCS